MIWADKLTTIYWGECLQVMSQLDDDSVSIVVADPPYSSGGATRGDRVASTSSKYQNISTTKVYSDFDGDARDQRSLLLWSALWLEQARRICREGGIVAVFCDWRNVAVCVDSVQVGGWVYRGLVPWIKPSARPQKGRFRQSAEFIVWGTNGPREQSGKCSPGEFSIPVASNKRHLTEKPVRLLEGLLSIADSDDEVVLDPFAGSGTTLKAARNLGLKSIGIEINSDIFGVAVERMKEPDEPFLV